MLRTSLVLISAWKIVTNCFANVSTSAKLPTKAIAIDFVICIGLECIGRRRVSTCMQLKK